MSLGFRAAIAAAAGAAVVLAAPFAQVAAEAVSGRRRTVVVVAPIVIVLLFAVYRIRSRPLSRYGALLASAVLGGGYVIGAGLTSGEAFHFAEYGAVALLFFWACRPLEDWSVVVLPVLAAVVFGTFDEWYQWFVPIRAGEARDVAINAVSGVCGVLAGIAIAPPERPWRGGAAAANRVAAWSAVTVVTFALFFYCVHIGYDIVDPGIGTFRSRYPLAQLEAMPAARAAAWRTNPPLTLRRVSREDQYLTEGGWHAQERNRAWTEGDIFRAWRENLILERYYTPLLDTSTYAGPGHRWPAEQRADAQARSGDTGQPYVSEAYPFPLYVLPGWLAALSF